jgi:2-keto-3-deoxy-L-rhamnonate aldolase RhmA
MSMGVDPGHPDHEAALQRFREGFQRAGKPCGIPLRGGAALVRERIAQGFRFIDSGSDMRLLEVSARKLLADIQA